jgi:hypothetical protein
MSPNCTRLSQARAHYILQARQQVVNLPNGPNVAPELKSMLEFANYPLPFRGSAALKLPTCHGPFDVSEHTG